MLITVVAEREANPDPDTIRTNRILIDHHLLPLIGGIKLTELTADDVDNWLEDTG